MSAQPRPEPRRHIAFEVYGVPIPKGSTKSFVVQPRRAGQKPRAVTTAANSKTGPWQDYVAASARIEMRRAAPYDGPVALCVRFFLPRAKSCLALAHTKKPDLDKLLRCVKDGLTKAAVYHDDAQVTLVLVRKDYAASASDPDGPGGLPRLVVEVGPMGNVQAAFVLGAFVWAEHDPAIPLIELKRWEASHAGVWPPGCPAPVE